MEEARGAGTQARKTTQKEDTPRKDTGSGALAQGGLNGAAAREGPIRRPADSASP